MFGVSPRNVGGLWHCFTNMTLPNLGKQVDLVTKDTIGATGTACPRKTGSSGGTETSAEVSEFPHNRLIGDTYIYIYIYMCVYVDVCMHACMHVCLYVCMSVSM